MSKDNEKIKELIKLSEENPELEILPMVNYEVCAGDDFTYWGGKIGEIDKAHVYETEEGTFLGYDQIVEHLAEELENNIDYDGISDDQIDTIVLQQYGIKKQSGEIKEVIIVYIELP